MSAPILPQMLIVRWPLIVSSISTLVIVFLFQLLFRSSSLASIPLIGVELFGSEKRRDALVKDAKSMYLEGYRKAKDSIFRVTTTSRYPVVVISPKYLPELRMLTDDVVSFDEAIKEILHQKYTGLGPIPHVVPIVRSSLTPALPRINGFLAREVQDAFRLVMAPCDDWTPVKINKKLLRIVAMASGRVFVGPELCRNEDYLNVAINYTDEVMRAACAIAGIPAWQRLFRASGLAEVKTLRQREVDAHSFLQPVVEARKKANAQNPAGKPDDMLQWLIDGYDKRTVDTSDYTLARAQLGISFAAIHTTTIAITNAFYNLATMPEVRRDLREEIRTVLARHGNKSSSAALQAMTKTDSFLKETMRFHPLSLTSFDRKVLKPFTLSSGQLIPADVIIQVPQHANNFDPDVYPDPEQFDHLRFHRLEMEPRKKGAKESRSPSQFVSVTPSSLLFGYGRHACPGRFFAANEIKMILANALLMYDMKMPDGSTTRYPNLEVYNNSFPDPERELLFKRVEQ